MSEVDQSSEFRRRIEAYLYDTPERISNPRSGTLHHNRWDERILPDQSRLQIAWTITRQQEVVLSVGHNLLHEVVETDGFALSTQYDLSTRMVLQVRRPVGTAHRSQNAAGTERQFREFDTDNDHLEISKLLDTYDKVWQQEPSSAERVLE